MSHGQRQGAKAAWPCPQGSPLLRAHASQVIDSFLSVGAATVEAAPPAAPESAEADMYRDPAELARARDFAG